MTRFLEAGYFSRRRLYTAALLVFAALSALSIIMAGRVFAAPTPIRIYDADLAKQSCTLDIREVTLDYETFVHTGAAFRYSPINQQSMLDFMEQYPDTLNDDLSFGRRFIVQPVQQDLNNYCGITQAGEYGAPFLLIQDVDDPEIFRGRQMYAGYDQYAVEDAPVMTLTLTSQAGTGEINASLSYVPPAAGSSQTDASRTTTNIVVTSGATYAELTGDGGGSGGGGGGAGGGGAQSPQLTFIWNDIRTIYRCTTTGSGDNMRCSGTPEETYVLQEWGDFPDYDGDDDRAIFYMTTSTLDSPSGRPRQELVSIGDRCQPRLTLSGQGNNSMDITFSDVSTNDINSLANALNTASTGGAGARFYNAERTVNDGECIDAEGDLNEVEMVRRSDDEERWSVWRNDLKRVFFNAVAPADGQPQMDSVFGPSTGSNERKYSMSYVTSVSAPPELFLLNSEISECTGSTDFVGITQISVAEAPAQWAAGDVIDASWKIADPDDLCSSFLGGGSGTTIAAKIRVMDASTYAPPTVPTEDVDAEAEPDNSCEGNSGILGWILCPVAGLLDNVLAFLDSEIQSLLAIDNEYFTGNNGDNLQDAWTQIRNIAYVILIPIMLVMVVGTALGFEVFSAYTIKKALPRMVIAIIFITLSWYICVFLVNFFNVVGGGIKGLVTYPFGIDDSGVSAGLKAAGLVNEGGQGWAGWSQDIVGGTAALGLATVTAFAAGYLSITVLLSTLGSAALILGLAFLVLVARQMFIIAMVLLGPLAILAWIFPGNDKLWKIWWNSFTKLLMMFPLIMLLIGLGDAFGTVIGGVRSDPEDSRLITIIMVIAAVVLPYAAIPFTFKFAGGVFGNLAGMVNDRNKGMLDRLKKGRAEASEKNREQTWARPKAAIAGMRYKGARKAMDRGGRTGRFLANRIGGYEWEAANSARNAEEAKRIQAEKDSGNDAQIRGSTANLAAIKKAQKAMAKAKASGDNAAYQAARNQLLEHATLNDDDSINKVKTLAGAEVSLDDAIMGQKRFKGNRSAQQAALTYELGKARSSEEIERVRGGFKSLAEDEWGMNGMEANGAWKGATFSTQNQHLELKSSDIDGSINHDKFVDEVFNTKGSYPASQMDAHFMKSLGAAWDETLDPGADMTADQRSARQEKIKGILGTFESRGIGGAQAQTEEGVPIGGGSGVSSAGSAAFEGELQKLAGKVRGNPVQGPRQQTEATEPTRPEPGTYRDNDGNTRQSGGPGSGGVILGG